MAELLPPPKAGSLRPVTTAELQPIIDRDRQALCFETTFIGPNLQHEIYEDGCLLNGTYRLAWEDDETEISEWAAECAEGAWPSNYAKAKMEKKPKKLPTVRPQRVEYKEEGRYDPMDECKLRRSHSVSIGPDSLGRQFELYVCFLPDGSIGVSGAIANRPCVGLGSSTDEK